MTRRPARRPPNFPVDMAAWKVIRETIPPVPPWPEEAASMDLRYHEECVWYDAHFPTFGKEPYRRPGWRVLARAWGWDGTVKGYTPYRVKDLLEHPERWARPPRREEVKPSPPPPDAEEEERAADDDVHAGDPLPDAREEVTGDRPGSNHDRTTIAPPTNHADPINADNDPQNEPRSPAGQPPNARTSTTGPADTAENAPKSPAQKAEGREQKTLFVDDDSGALSAEGLAACTLEQGLFLGVLKRWHRAKDAPEAWIVDYPAALAWFTSEIMPIAEDRGVDLAGALRRWKDWLEDAAARRGKPGTTGRAKFPRTWKNALRNWIEKTQPRRRTDDADRTPPSGAATPRPGARGRGRSGAATRRRGQMEGDAPATFSIRTIDGGTGAVLSGPADDGYDDY